MMLSFPSLGDGIAGGCFESFHCSRRPLMLDNANPINSFDEESFLRVYKN